MSAPASVIKASQLCEMPIAVLIMERSAPIWSFSIADIVCFLAFSHNKTRCSTEYCCADRCQESSATLPCTRHHGSKHSMNLRSSLHLPNHTMTLPLPIPPLRLFEIDDQSWFPPSLRLSVQACLTKVWKFQAPFLQTTSPASLVAHTLQSVLGPSNLQKYTFVDFCAGAGGPTPYIEREVNRTYKQTKAEQTQLHNQLGQNGHSSRQDEDDGENGGGVDFVLTDIHPHIAAWSQAAKRSDNILYVSSSVDAANAPKDLLALAGAPSYGNTVRKEKNRKIFRLFNLAFHHFDDELAIEILQNTLETSDGFAIFELCGRDVGNLVTELMLAPLLWLGSWYWFWGQWGQLFWTYVIPVIPFVVVFDGLVSCLRTRREGEVRELIARTEKGVDGWRFETGGEVHTWPMGTMRYFIGIKDGGKQKKLL